MDISVATLMLVGFSQVLLALLLLQVAVDDDESDVLDEDRPTTRLGKRLHALFTLSSSDKAMTLLPMGTRGPTMWPLRRAIISSMLMSCFSHTKNYPVGGLVNVVESSQITSTKRPEIPSKNTIQARPLTAKSSRRLGREVR